MGRAACGSSTDLELSEPRRLSTGHWVVDVKRVSDERRMAEITLTAALLPPRTNAKGKVVWSLPTDKDVAPRLGLHEQRAVFADYRKQRKEKKDANRALAQVRKRDDVKREKAERWGARTIQSAWRATLARQRYRHAVAYTRTLPSAQPREWFPAPAEDVSSPDGTVCRQDSEASSATQRSHREEDFSRIPGGILDGDGGDEGDEEDDDQAAPQSWLAATSSMRTRSVDDNAVRPVDNGPSLATLVASIGQAVPEDDKRRWVSSWKLATVERLDEAWTSHRLHCSRQRLCRWSAADHSSWSLRRALRGAPSLALPRALRAIWWPELALQASRAAPLQ
ncbi:hypothetical protein CTAYLR_004367 [Chrysophaeum taylorii]|uniref:Uncharacterized protein n=1 Tax=Chrysophaeum taylorii TaxID=2483200 RepID=A0AAD7UP15_9STRA|nr:hypothetical protein CTAYLR_004367 [Chrysophaeum taylorii]